MRRLAVMMLIFSALLLSASKMRDITPLMSIHNLPEEIEEPGISYRGVFMEKHIFASPRENALYLFPISGGADSEKFFFRRGTDRNEILSPLVMASMGNRIWVADYGNRISVFAYDSGKIRSLYTSFLPDMQVVISLFVTGDALFAFGRNMDGEYVLAACAYNGSDSRIIDNFGDEVPGNIIMGTGFGGAFCYLFEFDSVCTLYKDGKKKRMRLPLKTKISKKKDRRNGMIYNIGSRGPYTYVTYWTVKTGGTLLVLKNGKSFAVMDYPLGKGHFYNGNLFIYRFSFKDKKQASFIVEVKLDSIWE